MIGVIMAGGFAKRLWPITLSVAKPLLPLGKYRIIDLILRDLRDLKSLDAIYVTTNAFYKDQFENWIDETGADVILLIEEARKEEEKLGTIRAMYEAFKKIGDNEFLVIGGDNVMSLDFKTFLKFYAEKLSPVLAVYEVERIEDVSRFGEVTVDNDYKIVFFREKPKEPKSRLISTACYIFPRGIINYLAEYVKSGGKLDSPGHFIEWLYRRTNVYAFPFRGYWFDIGTPKGYIEAFNTINRGIIREETANISKDTVVREPSYLGKDTEISSSEVSSSLIWHGSVVRKSYVANSIILSDVIVENANIEWSIIGNKSKIYDVKLRSSIIGDFSSIHG